MNLINLVDRLAAEDKSTVAFAPDRCLHRRDLHQDCRRCRDICPAGAFGGEKLPEFDADSCAQCLACLPVCPVGAITAEDEVPPVLRFVRGRSLKRVELICRHHPHADKGPAGVPEAVSVRGCLAGLGVGALLLLVAEGVEHIVIRNDACADCQWHPLAEAVADQTILAQQWLQFWGMADRVQLSGPRVEGWRERPVYSAGSPPVSRRDLFRLRTTPPETGEKRAIPGGAQPFRERLRRLQAYQELGYPEQARDEKQLTNLGMAIVSLSAPTCNACGACARACPTSALTLAFDKETYTLSFNGRACLDCDVCAHVCPLDIVVVDRAPTFLQIFGEPDPLILQAGPVAHCLRCHAPFPAVAGEKYCPVCRFRLSNPFGAARPGAMIAENQVEQGIPS